MTQSDTNAMHTGDREKIKSSGNDFYEIMNDADEFQASVESQIQNLRDAFFKKWRGQLDIKQIEKKVDEVTSRANDKVQKKMKQVALGATTKRAFITDSKLLLTDPKIASIIGSDESYISAVALRNTAPRIRNHESCFNCNSTSRAKKTQFRVISSPAWMYRELARITHKEIEETSLLIGSST